jgi:hypothetical protein
VKVFSRLLILLSLVLLSVIGLNCASQPKPTEIAAKIERQLRATYKLPAEVPVVIGPLTPSAEWPGFDMFTATIGEGERKQDFPFLLAKDQKSIVRVNRIELSSDPYGDVMKKIDVRGRPVRGAKQSKVVVVAYDDLQCPFCTMMHQILFPELLKEYGDRVTFVYKDFPIPSHPWAIHAAVDANCLAAQNRTPTGILWTLCMPASRKLTVKERRNYGWLNWIGSPCSKAPTINWMPPALGHA